MNVVPRGLELVTVRRPLWVVACVDERAVTAPHDDAEGLEERPFVLTDEVHHQQLPRGVHSKRTSLSVTLVLDVPEGPVIEASTVIDLT